MGGLYWNLDLNINWIICPIEFVTFCFLLIVCLTCSTIFHITHKLVVRSTDLIRLRLEILGQKPSQATTRTTSWALNPGKVPGVQGHETHFPIRMRNPSRSTLLMCVCLDAQLCPALCDPMDGSPPGSSAHGIL